MSGKLGYTGYGQFKLGNSQAAAAGHRFFLAGTTGTISSGYGGRIQRRPTGRIARSQTGTLVG